MRKADLLKKELGVAAKIEDRGKRALAITAVLQKAFLSYQLYPVLVGGAAVEIYTRGLYASGDIDYVLPTSVELKRVMKQFGFKKEGRLFIHPQFQLIIEFPSSSLEKGENYKEMNYQGVLIRIISLEDLIIDRLNAFKWGRVSIEGQNIFLMLDQNSKGLKSLQLKAKKNDVWDALNDIIMLKRKIKREKINSAQATRLLTKMILKY